MGCPLIATPDCEWPAGWGLRRCVAHRGHACTNAGQVLKDAWVGRLLDAAEANYTVVAPRTQPTVARVSGGPHSGAAVIGQHARTGGHPQPFISQVFGPLFDLRRAGQHEGHRLGAGIEGLNHHLHALAVVDVAPDFVVAVPLRHGPVLQTDRRDGQERFRLLLRGEGVAANLFGLLTQSNPAIDCRRSPSARHS